MSEKRVIKINEDMFKIPSKTQKKRKESSSAIKVKTAQKGGKKSYTETEIATNYSK